MIELSRICKSYSLPHGKRKDVLRDVSITFRPGVNMGILGLNGQGKSTLIRIISGSERPDSGTVTRRSRVSWPIGFAGGFNGSLTGREKPAFHQPHLRRGHSGSDGICGGVYGTRFHTWTCR